MSATGEVGARADPRAAPPRVSWWREATGSVADLGVLVPIAVALVVMNGLSTTAVLLPAGLTYLMVARVYRLPVAVQPLKAFGAAAIAAGAGPETVAAGALIMGAVFLALGTTGWLDRVATVFPTAVIRGVQLAVGLTFGRIAWNLLTGTTTGFDHQPSRGWAVALAIGLTAALLYRTRALMLGVVLAAFATAVVLGGAAAEGSWWGPSALAVPSLDGGAFAVAALVLVLPQLPLTLTNSCLAPPDAARIYFGDRAAVVTPSRLARTLGVANLAAGAVAGMPLCHGAGGISAHYAAGARTARAPLLIGGALVVLSLGVGGGLASALTAFPIPVLAALLAVAGVAHIRLLADLDGPFAWSLALAVGIVGFAVHLGLAVLAGLLVALVAVRLRSRR